jgi:hypothetical protein
VGTVLSSILALAVFNAIDRRLVGGPGRGEGLLLFGSVLLMQRSTGALPALPSTAPTAEPRSPRWTCSPVVRGLAAAGGSACIGTLILFLVGWEGLRRWGFALSTIGAAASFAGIVLSAPIFLSHRD